MKKFAFEVTPKLIKKLKKYWRDVKTLEDELRTKIYIIERTMELDTDIEGIEFIRCDGKILGIGNDDRSMRLIYRSELQ